MLGHMKSTKAAPVVSRPRGRPKKNTKSRKKVDDSDDDYKPAKRPAPQRNQSSDRPSKVLRSSGTPDLIPRQEANTKRRLETVGKNVIRNLASEPIDLTNSDSDDDVPLLRRYRTRSYSRFSARPQEIQESEVSSYSPTPEPNRGVPQEQILLQEIDNYRRQLSDEKARADKLELEISCLKGDHAIELQNEKDRINDLRMQFDEEKDELTEGNDQLTIERDKLSIDLATTRSELEKALQAARDELKNSRIPISSSPTPSLSISASVLLTPTSNPQDDELSRLRNVKRTYLSVKKKYDTIFAIAKDLTAASRGMKLEYFGEFGGYVRQLNRLVETNGEDGGVGVTSQTQRQVRSGTDT
jgi:hypothetical protein